MYPGTQQGIGGNVQIPILLNTEVIEETCARLRKETAKDGSKFFSRRSVEKVLEACSRVITDKSMEEKGMKIELRPDLAGTSF
ncbi:MAG: hypothetical protein A4E65_00324 [Syntrophorhabdus sp. PtaU1.Bin153]|nr:MAG: hypothetical protein A4E65_00324 [Syntrophorhabdus sp. PtaU1.Bin153]